MRPEKPSADQPFGGPGTPALSISDVAYWPADSTQRASINLELTVNRRLNRATSECIAAAHDTLDGGACHIENSIRQVAADHLAHLSGTRANFTDDGYYIGVNAIIQDRTPTNASSETNTDAQRPPLTDWQQALLPELTDSVGRCLPEHEKDRTHALARDLARDIPSASDVIAAFDRVTLTEIINRHEERMETFARDLLPDNPQLRREATDIHPTLQAYTAVRLSQLSFPQHPAAALDQPHLTHPASATPIASTHRPGPSIDR
ncbi:hypothetical protein Achl_4631 (plasmid) [Pseudarthrobacter chlorophenolicus A6]|uniref:Uncharacterized protein n=1 Tax=Pseudarthrobacter chlorophenolicus (strain ATCC 700700 / DSM 12829 / CIP 107037 / JCM 12360 / KCTC 9906 / NCIMB 13794 / A6) TaxID=452863 RepID=B8HJI4_PSECP|nr:hypothetical protein Achl_4631 [Pseudarthrobacter chlorophenolicus A6]SDQ09276.1 hypothetical protein SAMN04489738_0046 [Pseudarthrobacter chlorophenolicus]